MVMRASGTCIKDKDKNSKATEHELVDYKDCLSSVEISSLSFHLYPDFR